MRNDESDNLSINKMENKQKDTELNQDYSADGNKNSSREESALNASLTRSRLLLGDQAIERLQKSCVLVAGCGGVGSFAVEALARSGIGRLILIDKDTVEPSNINRQLCALHSTCCQWKTDILKKRIYDINPDCIVEGWTEFYDQNMNDRIQNKKVDYILDCIDSIDSKKDLISFAVSQNIPIVSSMGMARRTDPSKLKITELEKTAGDPLAKILRTWKRKNRIRKKIPVVCSDELPAPVQEGQVLPSMIFVPGSAGLLMASKCIQDLSSGEKGARKN